MGSKPSFIILLILLLVSPPRCRIHHFFLSLHCQSKSLVKKCLSVMSHSTYS
uniref:Uncharacterized protein n=1 Tax=Anguilla anguilla TaxID=7936 RepID=A0A0E9PL45_ANGAN